MHIPQKMRSKSKEEIMMEVNFNELNSELKKCIDDIREQLANVKGERWVLGSAGETVLASNGEPLDFDIVCTKIESSNNAKFISNAPSNVAFLLSQIDRQDKEITELQKIIANKGFYENYDGDEVLCEVSKFIDEDDFLFQATQYVEYTRDYFVPVVNVTKTKIVFDGDKWMYKMTAEEEEFKGQEIEVYKADLDYSAIES